jgi:MerR family transcriptional regulator/heat shock protein HspR
MRRILEARAKVCACEVVTVRYLKLREVCIQLKIDEELLSTLSREGLVDVKNTSEDEPVVSAADAERLRVIVLLMKEMDVNLAGVEVILHMREDMFSMHRQFDEILRTLVEELRNREAK